MDELVPAPIDNQLETLAQPLDPKRNYPLIVPETFRAEWRPGLSNEEYHLDKSAANSSNVKHLLKSPATFYLHHVIGAPRSESKALLMGRALHMAMLEPRTFERLYLKSPDFGDQRSSKNREQKKEWLETLAPGAQVLSEEEFATLMGMIHSILKHREAANVIKYGLVECAGYFRHEETGILCRIKPDLFHPKAMILLDIKTTEDVTMDKFSRTIWNYRYDFQLAMYSAGIKAITGKDVEYPVFLAVEKKPPYEVALYIADSKLLSKGAQDFQFAMLRLKEALDKNEWAGYQAHGIETIELPAWATKELYE